MAKEQAPNQTPGAVSEYSEIEETIAPVALQTMGDWILAHTVKN